MRKHGCSILGFIVGLPTFALAYVAIRLPGLWAWVLKAAIVVLVSAWLVLAVYLVWWMVQWWRARQASRTLVDPPSYIGPEDSGPAGAQQQGRAEGSLQTEGPSLGAGRRIL